MKEIVISLIGFVIVYVGIKSLKKNRHLRKNGVKTMATVVSTAKTTNNINDDVSDRVLYRSTVKYTTKDNQTFEVELGDANALKDPIGSDKKIIYDPQSPKEAKSDNVLNMVIGPWLFLVLGTALFVWGLLELFSVTNVMN